MDDRLEYTHDFETMSKSTAYCNHIKNSKIETREVFELENLIPENIRIVQNMKKRTNWK